MPEPDVASRRQRLDGSCWAPFEVDRPGTTIPMKKPLICDHANNADNLKLDLMN
jgi:hypothetical protein